MGGIGTRSWRPASSKEEAKPTRTGEELADPPPSAEPPPRERRPPAGIALRPCTPEDLAARLAPLPVRALGLDARTERVLDRLGLKTIGALAAVPRPALMRRFADRPVEANPLVLLDRATGRRPEPVDAPPDARRFVARSRLAEPVLDVAPHLPELCEELRLALVGEGRGARLLRLTVYRVDGDWRSAEVATARATRDAAHMGRLLDGRVDRIDPGFGFDLLTLEALRTEPLDPRQAGLAGAADRGAAVDALLDRLTARLGPSRVMWTHRRESHLPERVDVPAPALGGRPAAPPVIGRERPPAPARPGRGGARALRRARRPAGPLRLAARSPRGRTPRRARAHRARMVARARRGAPARLLQGRGDGRPPPLDLPRGRARRRTGPDHAGRRGRGIGRVGARSPAEPLGRWASGAARSGTRHPGGVRRGAGPPPGLSTRRPQRWLRARIARGGPGCLVQALLPARGAGRRGLVRERAIREGPKRGSS